MEMIQYSLLLYKKTDPLVFTVDLLIFMSDHQMRRDDIYFSTAAIDAFKFGFL